MPRFYPVLVPPGARLLLISRPDLPGPERRRRGGYTYPVPSFPLGDELSLSDLMDVGTSRVGLEETPEEEWGIDGDTGRVEIPRCLEMTQVENVVTLCLQTTDVVEKVLNRDPAQERRISLLPRSETPFLRKIFYK